MTSRRFHTKQLTKNITFLGLSWFSFFLFSTRTELDFHTNTHWGAATRSITLSTSAVGLCLSVQMNRSSLALLAVVMLLFLLLPLLLILLLIGGSVFVILSVGRDAYVDGRGRRPSIFVLRTSMVAIVRGWVREEAMRLKLNTTHSTYANSIALWGPSKTDFRWGIIEH